MIPQANPVVKRAEFSIFIFLILLTISLLIYGVTLNEIMMWRIIAFSLAFSISFFTLYPLYRGIRRGDIIFVSVWKEIETPFVSDSYIDTIPSMALESGRRNQSIEVQLGDGSRGIVKVLDYGIIYQPRGRLMEVESPSYGGDMI